ncbi:MAG: hypothetical protein AAGA40_08295 [Cyanobacteria bacterium P01_E01_bin.45]
MSVLNLSAEFGGQRGFGVFRFMSVIVAIICISVASSEYRAASQF